MRRATRVAASLVVLAVACSTTGSDDHERACRDLLADFNRCTGATLPRLDCSTVSEADLQHIRDLDAQGTCALVADAMPLDGDLQSSTCRILGVGCVAGAVRAENAPVTQYPIVLVNGFDTSPLFRWSDRIARSLRGRGHRVYLATLSPYDAPRVRAPELATRVREVLASSGAARVNLVCHSLGGLDCRYLASPGGLSQANVVASVTTVGTAHRGTRVAESVLGLLPDGNRGQTLNDFATLVGEWFSPSTLQRDVHLRDALTALTTAEAAAFSAEIIDADGVYYQSWAGTSHAFGTSTASDDSDARNACAPSASSAGPFTALPNRDYLALPLLPFASLAATGATREPNDGFVSVASAKWGTFRGCIPADHMEQLGQRSLPDVNVRTGFDVAAFYTYVAGDLAARGF